MNDRADPRELLQRYAGNPILRPHDFPTMVNAVLNPGATVIDGRTLLLLRVEHRTGLSSLVVATSQDGLTGWEIDRVRGLAPLSDGFEEHWGIEDPRITRVGDEYFVVYVGYSTAGPLVCLAKTRDFLHWERSGVLQPPEDKDAALFPTTFAGRWALIHRPVAAMSGLGTHIWISFSPDLRHWGDARVLHRGTSRRLVGLQQGRARSSPIAHQGRLAYLLPRGSVLASGSIYRLGLALLDKSDPTKVLAAATSRSSVPRRPTNAPATSPTWCSPVAGCSATTATPCTCTTGRPTVSSASPRQASRDCCAISKNTPSRPTSTTRTSRPSHLLPEVSEVLA